VSQPFGDLIVALSARANYSLGKIWQNHGSFRHVTRFRDQALYSFIDISQRLVNKTSPASKEADDA
jgi:hypothetical protein